MRLDADVFDPLAFVPFLNVVNAGLGELEGIDWDRVEPHNRAALRRRPGTSTASPLPARWASCIG